MELSRNSPSTAAIGLRWDQWQYSPGQRIEADVAYGLMAVWSPRTTEVYHRVVIDPLCFPSDLHELPRETMSALPGRNLSPITDPLEAFYALASHGVAHCSEGERYVASALLRGGVMALLGGNVQDGRHPIEYAKHALAVKALGEPNPNVFIYGIDWVARGQIQHKIGVTLLQHIEEVAGYYDE